MKKRILLIISMILLLGISLSSCGYGLADTKEIDNITAKLLDDGSTEITITYVDDLYKPLVFVIPKGEAGEDGAQGETGNGIKEITMTQVGANNCIKIFFTDPNMEPFEYIVKDGVGIKNIESHLDEITGDTYLILIFSDNSRSDKIKIPRGDQGVGIESITHKVNPDKSVEINIKLTNGKDTVLTIPAPEKGDPGRGIVGVASSFDELNYILTVFYSDGEFEELKFPKPSEPNKWYTGETKPLDSFGNEGDFFFDVVHNIIYTKLEGSWGFVVDFNGNEETFTVTFDITDYPDAVLNSTKKSFEIVHGYNFQSTKFNLPLPTRPGYKFMGWYADKEINANSGKFTDLTIVCGNITLYPQWELAK